MRSLSLVVAAFVTMSVAVGCAVQSSDESVASSTSLVEPEGEGSGTETTGAEGDVGDLEDAPLVAADDSAPPSAADEDALAGLPEAKTTTAVNLRKGADATSGVLAIVPEGMVLEVESQRATNGFYNVSWNGVSGYVSASFLVPEGNMSALDAESDDAVDVDGAPSPANALARAKLAMGFSYYWGGGAWTKVGVTPSTKGSCTGSCPNCTHRGSYGADCSGLVAKAWQYGAKSLTTNSHPYGTIHFVKDVPGKWKTISRASMKPGDALVYNKNGSGHIVIYEKGDAWGAPTVMECRSCGYGCVRNARSFGSSYHAIRRAGF